MGMTLEEIAAFLDDMLKSAQFPGDQNGIYHASSRPIERIGLALEPWAGMGEWVERESLDALFLHRPWRLDTRQLPQDIGILAYHLVFDLTLTFGYNPWLANALSIMMPVPFAFKETIPYGMYGDIQPTTLQDVEELLQETFGIPIPIEGVGEESRQSIKCIAVVGAMSDSLVREAALQDVQLYITGQFRPSAKATMCETRMLVAVIGHATGELWGLQALGKLLRERWPQIAVACYFSCAH
jgi:putative NIF3 family GTP cyclohydrolase 1 type 2